VPWDHDVSLVRAMWAGLRFLAIDGGAEEVGAWVLAGRVDVVVLGILAHLMRNVRRIQRTIVCVKRQSAVRTGARWSEKMGKKYIVISSRRVARAKPRYEKKMSKSNLTVVIRSSEAAGTGRGAILYIKSIGPPADRHVSGAPTIMRPTSGLTSISVDLYSGRTLPGCNKSKANVGTLSDDKRSSAPPPRPERMDVRRQLLQVCPETFMGGTAVRVMSPM